MRPTKDAILEDLADLLKQATTERSHKLRCALLPASH